MKSLLICSSALLALSISVFASISIAQEAAGRSGGSAQIGLTEFPLPKGEEAYGDIDGKHVWQYVVEQAKIATDYRDNGHPQYWGRIAGTSGDEADAQWLMNKYHQIGLTDVHAQTIKYFVPQWVGKSWTVTLAGGGKEVRLVSAQPTYGSPTTNGKELDLEAVYVGLGSEADFAGRDVRGKAVVMVIGPLLHSVGSPAVRKRAMDHGAAAILGFELRDGNHNMQGYNANTNVPTFHLGTADGIAVRDLFGSGAHPHLKMRLDADWVPNEKSYLVWGTLPGATNETIYVHSHRDGWFEAAGDNASGVATMLGLAEHFAKIPQSQRRRTMIFIGTDGHHNGAPLGEAWLVANRARLFAKTALMIHPEHPAEVLTHGDDIDKGNEGIMTSEPTTVGIPNEWYAGGDSRSQLTKIAADAFSEFGVPVVSKQDKVGAGGDLNIFRWFVPGVGVQSNDFHNMHTEIDNPDSVSWTGLEAVTRAFAKIIDEVNKLSLADLQRPEENPTDTRQSLIPAHCTAWIKDPSADCTP
jgi:hypothetical protein